ncbi:hypothetical protein OAR42_02220 [Planktomarina temperata]|nr:hypothetical protein [Planktomarina temperata]
MQYILRKTAKYGARTYGPYGSYQEALDASKELENDTINECFFKIEHSEDGNKPTYKVWIDDNFHFMDEDERLFHGEFATPTQAILACQKIVDANIESITENETDPDKAYESYVCFGDDPWIQGIDFSAFEYAKQRIQEVLRG